MVGELPVLVTFSHRHAKFNFAMLQYRKFANAGRGMHERQRGKHARGYVPVSDCIGLTSVSVQMDAMSEAVEGAEVLLYAVSEKYKESANCR